MFSVFDDEFDYIENKKSALLKEMASLQLEMTQPALPYLKSTELEISFSSTKRLLEQQISSAKIKFSSAKLELSAKKKELEIAQKRLRWWQETNPEVDDITVEINVKKGLTSELEKCKLTLAKTVAARTAVIAEKSAIEVALQSLSLSSIPVIATSQDSTNSSTDSLDNSMLSSVEYNLNDEDTACESTAELDAKSAILKHNDLVEQHRDLGIKLSSIDATITQTSDRIQDITNVLANFSSDLHLYDVTAAEAMKDCNTNVAKIQGEITSLETEMSSLTDDICAVQNILQRSETCIESIWQTRAGLVQVLSSLNLGKQVLSRIDTNTHNELREQVVRLSNELDNNMLLIEKLRQRIDAVTSKVQSINANGPISLQMQIEQLENETARIKLDYINLLRQTNALNAELNNISGTTDLTESLNDTGMTSSNQIQKQKLVDTKRELTELQAAEKVWLDQINGSSVNGAEHQADVTLVSRARQILETKLQATPCLVKEVEKTAAKAIMKMTSYHIEGKVGSDINPEDDVNNNNRGTSNSNVKKQPPAKSVSMPNIKTDAADENNNNVTKPVASSTSAMKTSLSAKLFAWTKTKTKTKTKTNTSTKTNVTQSAPKQVLNEVSEQSTTSRTINKDQKKRNRAGTTVEALSANALRVASDDREASQDLTASAIDWVKLEGQQLWVKNISQDKNDTEVESVFKQRVETGQHATTPGMFQPSSRKETMNVTEDKAPDGNKDMRTHR